MKQLLRIGLELGCWLLFVCTLLAFLSQLGWQFALLDQLRLQFALAAAVGLGLALGFGRKRRLVLSLVCLGALLLNLRVIWPSQSVNQATATSFSVAHINTGRGKLEAVEYLANGRDDIVFLQEYTPGVEQMVAESLPNYDVVASRPLWNTHGSAMLVKHGWGGVVHATEFINQPAYNERPLLVATIEIDGVEAHLMSFHAIRPRFTSGHEYRFQRTEYSAVAAWVEEKSAENILLIGDFNGVPWSANTNILRQATLQTSGIQTTWPAQLPAPLRLPLDYVMHSPAVDIVSARAGARFGSDHRPLHVVVALHASK